MLTKPLLQQHPIVFAILGFALVFSIIHTLQEHFQIKLLLYLFQIRILSVDQTLSWWVQSL